MARRWLFTVSSPITSLVAIPRFDSPLTTYDSISLSRCDRPWRAPGPNSSRRMRAAGWAGRAALAGAIGVAGARRHAGVDRCFTAVNELELTDELVAADALEQITRGADPHRLKEVLLIVVHRQHDDLPVRVTFTQRLAQIQPAAALHAHVAEHDVRVQLLDHLERALGAHCLADNAHPVGERGQHCLEALDHHLLVVDQHDSHWSGSRTHALTIEPTRPIACPIPPAGDAAPGGSSDAHCMRRQALAMRRFWWDRAGPADAAVRPLPAVIFDLDGAMADIEREGNREAFNAAFAAHALDIRWDEDDYARLLSISDERQRIATDLRRRGFGAAADETADDVIHTKDALFADCVLDGDVAARSGL